MCLRQLSLLVLEYCAQLRHGSFASILDALGQQALELQLERFFTVWAWKWDIESPTSLQEHFGMRVHPKAKALAPLVEGFETKLPADVLATPARATVRAMVELAVLNGCDYVQTQKDFPLATGRAAQLSFREHPFLGVIAVFHQHLPFIT